MSKATVKLADLWWRIMNTEAPQEDQVGRWRRSEEPIDVIPQPGYVGSKYRTGGTLILGMNPGNAASGLEEGNDSYYEALARMRNAANRVSAFLSLNQVMESVSPSWPLHRKLIRHVLCACGLKLNEVAQVNLFKWRTSKISRGKRTKLYEWNWPQTSEQVRCLNPGHIILLGMNVRDFVQKKWGEEKLCKAIPRTPRR